MDSVLTLFGVMMALTLPACLIIFITQHYKLKNQTNTQLAKLQKEMGLNSTKDLQTEIVQLKERIEVLERIVTDNSYQVDRKIQSL